MALHIVIDTSAYSHFRRGHTQIQHHLASCDTALVPTIVLGELEAGFQRGSRYEENSVVLQEFLSEPFVRTLDVTPQVSRIYGRYFTLLRSAGTPIPTNDIWIAACATSVGAVVVTFDPHFTKIPQLDVELLTP